jgi:hypothetical protein
MLRQQSEPSSTHAIVAKPEHGTAATDLPDDLLNPRPPNARPHRRIRRDRIRRVTRKLPNTPYLVMLQWITQTRGIPIIITLRCYLRDVLCAS